MYVLIFEETYGLHIKCGISQKPPRLKETNCVRKGIKCFEKNQIPCQLSLHNPQIMPRTSTSVHTRDEHCIRAKDDAATTTWERAEIPVSYYHNQILIEVVAVRRRAVRPEYI